ncbi:MAG: hypothetical protein ACI8XO_001703 [Verrucomicrobiales bacterium]|jgi:hypothetical protein
MKAKLILRTTAMLAAAASMVSCATLAPPSKLEIEPQADSLLKAMSDKLAAAQQFSVKAVRTLDPQLVEGTNAKLRANIEFDVARPNRFQGSTRDSESTRQLFYDGKQMVIWDKTADVYATVPAPNSIDKTIDQLEEKWGVQPPLADLLVSDPYSSLTGGEGSAKLAGTERINGVACDHVSVTQQNIDWDIWIAQSDSLPRKFVITMKDRPGKPQLSGVFSEWNLNAMFPPSHFEPRVGKNSTKIEMIPMN